MGYGAGHAIKLNSKGGQVIFTGKSLKVIPDFDSWDMTHPMDGMTSIKMDLLKVKVDNIILTKEEIQELKEQGIKRGEYISFKFEHELKGQIWSGYVRSPISKSFPIELKGEIELYTAHGYFTVTAKIRYNNLTEFKNFIEDVLDYYVSDEDAKLYAKENDTNKEQAVQELYHSHSEDMRFEYGAILK